VLKRPLPVFFVTAALLLLATGVVGTWLALRDDGQERDAVQAREPTWTPLPRVTASPTPRPHYAEIERLPSWLKGDGSTVQVDSITPPLGEGQTADSVTVSATITYDGGPFAGVISLHVLYCFAPGDCNLAVGSQEVRPDTHGTATIGSQISRATVDAGRPVVICEVAAVIGYARSPQGAWYSDRARDPRCYDVRIPPHAKITSFEPPLGTQLQAGDVISMTIEVEDTPADRIVGQAWTGTDCAALKPARAEVRVTPGQSGTSAITIAVEADAAGSPLQRVGAILMFEDTFLREYDIDSC
jgi:hypothetical protein